MSLFTRRVLLLPRLAPCMVRQSRFTMATKKQSTNGGERSEGERKQAASSAVQQRQRLPSLMSQFSHPFFGKEAWPLGPSSFDDWLRAPQWSFGPPSPAHQRMEAFMKESSFSTDMVSKDGQYVVTADLPGLEKGEIKVECKGV